MTVNYFDDIGVYFHMRNHYRMLKNVKSTIDNSFPQSLMKSSQSAPRLQKQLLKKPRDESADRKQRSSRTFKRNNCCPATNSTKSDSQISSQSATPRTVAKKKTINEIRKPGVKLRSSSAGAVSQKNKFSGKLLAPRKSQSNTPRSLPDTEKTSRPKLDELNLMDDKNNMVGKKSIVSSKSPKEALSFRSNSSENGNVIEKKPSSGTRRFITASTQEHEYLLFLLRITEDIISKDYYSNNDIRKVFDSHIEANKGHLDPQKMETHILRLSKELNIVDESNISDSNADSDIYYNKSFLHSNSSQSLISADPHKHCECGTLRKPPLRILSSEDFNFLNTNPNLFLHKTYHDIDKNTRNSDKDYDNTINKASEYQNVLKEFETNFMLEQEKMENKYASHVSGDGGTERPVGNDFLTLLNKLSLGRVTECTEPSTSVNTLGTTPKYNMSYSTVSSLANVEMILPVFENFESVVDGGGKSPVSRSYREDAKEDKSETELSEKNESLESPKNSRESNNALLIQLDETSDIENKENINSDCDISVENVQNLSESDENLIKLFSPDDSFQSQSQVLIVMSEGLDKILEKLKEDSDISLTNLEKNQSQASLERISAQNTPKAQLSDQKISQHSSEFAMLMSQDSLDALPRVISQNRNTSIDVSKILEESNSQTKENASPSITPQKSQRSEEQVSEITVIEPKIVSESLNSVKPEEKDVAEPEVQESASSPLVKIILDGKITQEDYMLVKGPVYVLKALVETEPQLVVFGNETNDKNEVGKEVQENEDSEPDSLKSNATYTVSESDIVAPNTVKNDNNSLENIFQRSSIANSHSSKTNLLALDAKTLDNNDIINSSSDYDLTPQRDDNNYSIASDASDKLCHYSSDTYHYCSEKYRNSREKYHYLMVDATTSMSNVNINSDNGKDKSEVSGTDEFGGGRSKDNLLLASDRYVLEDNEDGLEERGRLEDYVGKEWRRDVDGEMVVLEEKRENNPHNLECYFKLQKEFCENDYVNIAQLNQSRSIPNQPEILCDNKNSLQTIQKNININSKEKNDESDVTDFTESEMSHGEVRVRVKDSLQKFRQSYGKVRKNQNILTVDTSMNTSSMTSMGTSTMISEGETDAKTTKKLRVFSAPKKIYTTKEHHNKDS